MTQGGGGGDEEVQVIEGDRGVGGVVGGDVEEDSKRRISCCVPFLPLSVVVVQAPVMQPTISANTSEDFVLCL